MRKCTDLVFLASPNLAVAGEAQQDLLVSELFTVSTGTPLHQPAAPANAQHRTAVLQQASLSYKHCMSSFQGRLVDVGHLGHSREAPTIPTEGADCIYRS